MTTTARASAVEEFEATSESSRAGKQAHVGAVAEMHGILLEITERIRLLDGLVHTGSGMTASCLRRG